MAAGSTLVLLALGVGIAATSGAKPSPRDRAAKVVHSAAGTTSTDASPKQLSPEPTTVPPTTVPPNTDTSNAAPVTAGSRAPAAAAQASSSSTTTTTAPPSSSSSSSSSQPTAVDGSDGSLAATLTATRASVPVGASVSFVLSITDSAATGPVGPTSLTYGDGQPVPETGMAASCHAGASPAPVNESYDYSHAYAEPGSYTVSVTVSAPCSSQQVVLDLPITVAAS
jgi:hypothetical protein